MAQVCEADEISGLRLSGYGTISSTFDDSDQIAPFRDVSASSNGESLELADNLTWRLDSRIGLQVDYHFGQKMELVFQGVLRDRNDPDVKHSIELAYLGIRPLTNMDVRVGRFGYDAFMMSDIRHTGYAYLWVRPPLEFYGWIPIFNIDGADVTWRINQDDAQWRIRVQRGRHDTSLPMGGNSYSFDTNDIWSFTIARQSGPFRIKAGYSQFSSQNELESLSGLHKGLEDIAAATAGMLPDVSAEAASLRNDIRFKDNGIRYMTIGAAYDDGTLVAQAEIARSMVEGDFIPNGEMGYASVGYRLGDFTPYFTFSTINPGRNALHKPESDWSLIEQASLQSSSIRMLNSTAMEQHTYSSGLRWDFHNQASLKFQWDNTHIHPLGYGLWWRKGNILEQSNTVNLYSISMEFVF
ncbi:MAG: hypothetical protein HQK61_12210 [Desulfamplus sp.]|nr:hypothetical protein [Desulfamplus sp.]